MKRHRHSNLIEIVDDSSRDIDRSENEGFFVMYASKKTVRLKVDRK